jgi:hypothetical protein
MKENRYFYLHGAMVYIWGMKTSPFEEGQIVKSKDERIGKIIEVTEDIDYKNMVVAKCDTQAVTEEEKIEFEEAELEKKKENARQAMDDLYTYLKRNGIYKKEEGQIEIEGETIYNTFNITGGGSKIIINDKEAWLVVNNAMDGDDWSKNNVYTGGAGAIGYCKKRDDTIEKILNKIKLGDA